MNGEFGAGAAGVTAYGGSIAKESMMKARHAGQNIGLANKHDKERQAAGKSTGGVTLSKARLDGMK